MTSRPNSSLPTKTSQSRGLPSLAGKLRRNFEREQEFCLHLRKQVQDR